MPLDRGVTSIEWVIWHSIPMRRLYLNGCLKACASPQSRCRSRVKMPWGWRVLSREKAMKWPTTLAPSLSALPVFSSNISDGIISIRAVFMILLNHIAFCTRMQAIRYCLWIAQAPWFHWYLFHVCLSERANALQKIVDLSQATHKFKQGCIFIFTGYGIWIGSYTCPLDCHLSYRSEPHLSNSLRTHEQWWNENFATELTYRYPAGYGGMHMSWKSYGSATWRGLTCVLC